jgi:Protein of unknown function (DUF1592)/Protein of unknown function (DUF1588)/Protein of unknown function (DUF1585)/Protein of unknown function (DUF1595)/Protein of unknown function (DUF1587)
MNKRFAALAALSVLSLVGCGPSEPKTSGAPVNAQRLSAAQYRQIISDVFAPDIKLGGRFEPGARKNGLLAVGASAVSMSASGFEQYDRMARTIAGQVVDAKHRDALIPCKPADVKKPDEACATQVITKYARLLYRRPATDKEIAGPVQIAGQAADAKGDFYTGLSYGLAQLLDSPNFIFRKDVAETDPSDKTQLRLSAWSKASRLSFFLWNTAPDEELLRAAQAGELDSRSGLAKQIDRLLASPRLENGVRAFFIDFLDFDQFDSLAKDAAIYPVFSQKVARDAQEQTLRTAIDLLVTQKGDYRDLFTTRKTFLTRNLGVVYQVPVKSEKEWEAHEFPADDPHAGILTQLSFTELHSHPGRSSSTLRGKAVREILLCQIVPSPPANVNFTVVQDTNNPNFKTARDRLTAHRTEATCAGCHKIMDPIGLGLENFDGVGQFRSTENGANIDASGEIDGIKFSDAASLGQAIHDNPAATACLTNSMYRYAVGRDFDPGEREFQAWLGKQFAEKGYRVPDLMKTIATSDAFFAVRPSAGAVKEASNDK